MPHDNPPGRREGEPERNSPADEVLLALVDLAREQATELERQNDALRLRNEELVKANQHKTEFLTTISHELRTPLAIILGYAELLRERISGPLTPDQAEYVSDIERAGTNLLTLINDLLDIAKVDAGRMDFQKHLLDLTVPVAAAVELARGLALRKQIELSLHLDAPVVACVGDEQRIRQVALNLLSNAVKFTPERGAVRVTVRTSEEGVELAVEDSGIGIDAADLQRLFEPFVQLDAGERRGYGGTGLGLALVRRFVRRMGGDVTVRSAHGEGSTFAVRLPSPAAGEAGVGLLTTSRASTQLTELLAAEGIVPDLLGSPEAFAVRAGTRLIVVEVSQATRAVEICKRVRTLAAAEEVTTLVLLPPSLAIAPAVMDALAGTGAVVESFDPADPAAVRNRVRDLRRSLTIGAR